MREGEIRNGVGSQREIIGNESDEKVQVEMELKKVEWAIFW